MMRRLLQSVTGFWKRSSRAKRLALVVMAVVVLITVLREAGVIEFDAYSAESQMVRCGSFAGMPAFSPVQQVTINDGSEAVQVIQLLKQGGLVRLTVANRDSHWPIGSFLPLVTCGTSTHRICFDVEFSNNAGKGWDRYGTLGNITATYTATTWGLLSHRDYRRWVLRQVMQMTASEFLTFNHPLQTLQEADNKARLMMMDALGSRLGHWDLSSWPRSEHAPDLYVPTLTAYLIDDHQNEFLGYLMPLSKCLYLQARTHPTPKPWIGPIHCGDPSPFPEAIGGPQ